MKTSCIRWWWIHSRPKPWPTCTSRPKPNQRPNNKKHVKKDSNGFPQDDQNPHGLQMLFLWAKEDVKIWEVACKILSIDLLGHALLNNGLLNLLTSLQIMLIQAQLCTRLRIDLQDSSPHGAKFETCEGCHLARDPCLLYIQWCREEPREQVMHLLHFLSHFLSDFHCIKEGFSTINENIVCLCKGYS